MKGSVFNHPVFIPHGALLKAQQVGYGIVRQASHDKCPFRDTLFTWESANCHVDFQLQQQLSVKSCAAVNIAALFKTNTRHRAPKRAHPLEP